MVINSQMFMRIGDSLVNKHSILGFIKNKTSILLIDEPLIFLGFYRIVFGTEYYFNSENECSKAFENIQLHDILNDYTHKKYYTGNALVKLVKKAEENEFIKKK